MVHFVPQSGIVSRGCFISNLTPATFTPAHFFFTERLHTGCPNEIAWLCDMNSHSCAHPLTDIHRNQKMNMTLKRALAFTVVSSLLLCLQAGGAPHPPAASPPIASELQLLQGTWEGIVVGDKGTSKNPDFQKTSERRPG